MTEHDLHDPLRRLAETAPAPASGLAGDIVARGRATRRRRLGAAAVAGSAAVAALVVVAPLLGSGGGDRSGEPPVATAPTQETTEPTPPPAPSPRMRVAAAAVRTLIGDNYPSARVLWVRKGVCESGNPPGGRDCTALTEREMAVLERLLQAYTIRWVRSSALLGAPLGEDPL